MVSALHLPFSPAVVFSPVFLHLYVLPRLPGLEIESYGDLSIVLFLGEKRVGSLSFSNSSLKSVNAICRLCIFSREAVCT